MKRIVMMHYAIRRALLNTTLLSVPVQKQQELWKTNPRLEEDAKAFFKLPRPFAATAYMEDQLGIAPSSYAGMHDYEVRGPSWNDVGDASMIWVTPVGKRGFRHVPLLPVLASWLRAFYGSQGPVFASQLLDSSCRRRLGWSESD